MHSVRSRFAFVIGLLTLAALAAAPAQARLADGPGRIVFVAGKSRHCHQGACRNLDVVRAISPHGGRAQALSEIRSVTELATSDDGTVAVLSKDVAGAGANAGAFVQIYLIHLSGKRTAVFRQRLQRFNATGLGISGDGRLLALSGRFTEDLSARSKIWLVRADGTGMRQLTTGPGADEMPALSADGKRVAFVRTLNDGTPSGRRPELYTVPVAGGEPARLTENTVEDVNPVFSPDGRSIAFGEASRRRRGSVQVIRTDGTNQRPVTGTGLEYPDPDYSPNGRSLVFAGQVSGARPHEDALYTVRASGTARRLLTDRFDDPGLAQWTA
jgi:dipeptidyl aminopeptidase/acylaminoacyl peptidase